MARAGKALRGRETEALFEDYKMLSGTFDEYFKKTGRPHPWTKTVVQHLETLGREEFRSRFRLAHANFLEGGITFSVYSDAKVTCPRLLYHFKC